MAEGISFIIQKKLNIGPQIFAKVVRPGCCFCIFRGFLDFVIAYKCHLCKSPQVNEYARSFYHVCTPSVSAWGPLKCAVTCPEVLV